MNKAILLAIALLNPTQVLACSSEFIEAFRTNINHTFSGSEDTAIYEAVCESSSSNSKAQFQSVGANHDSVKKKCEERDYSFFSETNFELLTSFLPESAIPSLVRACAPTDELFVGFRMLDHYTFQVNLSFPTAHGFTAEISAFEINQQGFHDRFVCSPGQIELIGETVTGSLRDVVCRHTYGKQGFPINLYVEVEYAEGRKSTGIGYVSLPSLDP